MRIYEKKGIRLLVSILLVICLITDEKPAGAGTNSADPWQTDREAAVTWLKEQAGEGNEWKDHGLINLTCDVLAVLRMEKETMQSRYLEQWEEKNKEKNLDEMAHCSWAVGDGRYLEEMWKEQNPDGGFGITGEYMSEGYDTLLVLMAAAASGGDVAGPAGEAAAYLLGTQNKDGGFGAVRGEGSEPGYSAEAGMALCSMGTAPEEKLAGLDAYCLGQFRNEFGEENFREQAELARYLYRRGCIPDPEETEKRLNSLPEGDGSIHGNVRDTLQYILLLREMEEYHRLKFQAASLETKADTYVLETGMEQEITLDSTITYAVNQEMEGTIRYILLEDGEEIHRKEEKLYFQPEKTQEKSHAVLGVKPLAGKNYKLRTELITGNGEGGETCWKKQESSFSLHETREKKLELEIKEPQEYSHKADLKWNDISDGDARYRYRVYRRKEEEEWQNQSVWDGAEKVKVLNIYPNIFSKDYLDQWLNETVSSSEEPAGKGLFEIDKVLIDEYNRDPEKYLLNGDKEYQYDVLVFGTYDNNAYKDISTRAYAATESFIKAGGGVLFGHDTVGDNFAHRGPTFRGFSKYLGIRLIPDYDYAACRKVRVVNNGFLTSYPWKLSGVLDIPATHSTSQYSGGELDSVVWMEFEKEGLSDPETGAKNTAYLCTNNNTALIQTGHSSGKATDDERKVLANTLFYLKQLTEKTEMTDPSFYDEEPPEKASVSDLLQDSSGETFVEIKAGDKGTSYQYYVEAAGMNEDQEETIRSNIPAAEAVSGVRGFIVGISDSTEPMKELVTYDEEGNLTSEVTRAEDGQIKYTVDHKKAGTYYLHVYTVDYAGNISGESTKEIKADPVDFPEQAEYIKCPYRLFAQSGEAEINCCEAEIEGDVYGSEAVKFQGSVLNLAGRAVSADKICTAGWKINLGGREEQAEPRYLPDYAVALWKEIEMSGEKVKELQAYNSIDIMTPVLCKTSTGAYCPSVHIEAHLICGGSVVLNANTIQSGEQNPSALCSQNGDITIQATKLTRQGMIYAPKGTVTINVSELDYTGSIIAERIKIQAGYIHLRK